MKPQAYTYISHILRCKYLFAHIRGRGVEVAFKRDGEGVGRGGSINVKKQQDANKHTPLVTLSSSSCLVGSTDSIFLLSSKL